MSLHQVMDRPPGLMHQAIARLHIMAQGLQRPPALPQDPRMRQTSKELAGMFEGAAPPPPVEQLHEIAERITEQVHAGNSDAIAQRDWRRAPWCLWLPQQRLADDAAVCDAYLRWLRQRRRWDREYSTLAAAYLRDFKTGDDSFREIGQALAVAAGRYETAWRERHKQFALFSPTEAPKRIAGYVMSAQQPVDACLHQVFDVRPDEDWPGMEQAAFQVACDRYRDTLGATSDPADTLRDLQRLTTWAVNGGLLRPSGGLKAGLANGLLYPWWANDPGGEVAEHSRGFLLRHYRDPRLHPGGWNGVDEDARAVMMRWLARASLQQFLDIVSEIATPALRLQWPYRREFWDAYEQRGVIDEAWVAFASQGENMVNANFESLPFGRLHVGVQASHAVLILKLGGLTIAEWSENGKCHIWLTGNADAPSLYQQTYSGDELRGGADKAVIHHGSEAGYWQRQVADYVYKHTGIQHPRYPRGIRRIWWRG